MIVGMINGHRYTLPASLSHESRGVSDRATIGRVGLCDASACDVDGHPGLAERNRYSLSGSAARACHNGYRLHTLVLNPS
jgi:hypothetical protein